MERALRNLNSFGFLVRITGRLLHCLGIVFVSVDYGSETFVFAKTTEVYFLLG